MADEATDALIARYVWQEENASRAYGSTYGVDSDHLDSDDSDYGGAKRKRKSGGKASKAKKRAAPGPKGAAASPPDTTSAHAAKRRRAGAAAERATGDKENEQGAGAAEDDDAKSATGRKKRKDKGAPRQAGRPWSEEEEARFLQALQAFGRGWKRCAEHVGSRDTKQFTSHAQKHFIKQCLQGLPLPPKVAESGLGYTLSGKKLNPTSAAAAAYGFKIDILRKLPAERLQVALGGVDAGGLPVDLQAAAAAGAASPASSAAAAEIAPSATGGAEGGAAGRASSAVAAAGAASASDGTDGTCGAGACSASGAGAAAALQEGAAGAHEDGGRAAAAGAAAASDGGGTAAADGGTRGTAGAASTSGSAGSAEAAKPAAAGGGGEGAGRGQRGAASGGAGGGGEDGVPASEPTKPPQGRQRSRNPPKPPSPPAPPREPTEYARNRPRRERASKAQVGETSESLDLVRCCEYSGTPGSGAASQPFSVEIAAQALLVMDFQAHLSSSEVIGMLGGTWDVAARKLVVAVAHPCRRAEGSGARTSVESDAGAQVEAAASFERQGLTCVGWYHSHPTFEPSPSQKDMDNQRNQQAHFRDPGTGVEPFIGLIVGPYDLALPTPCSAVTAFNVQQQRGAGGSLTPYHIRYTTVGGDEMPDAEAQDLLLGAIEMFKEDTDRVDMNEVWRPFTVLTPAGEMEGEGISKMAKMQASLRRHLGGVEGGEVATFVQGLCLQLRMQWGLPQE